jgi:hypothetical protein
MIRKNKKALAAALAATHVLKALDFWNIFRNSEALKSLERAEIISPQEAFEIALDAMHLALTGKSND